MNSDQMALSVEILDTHKHTDVLECNGQKYCHLFKFYSLSIQYGKKKIKYIDYEKQHLYFYMGESPWSQIPYHSISLKQAVVTLEDTTGVLSQRDQPMLSYNWEKQNAFF